MPDQNKGVNWRYLAFPGAHRQKSVAYTGQHMTHTLSVYSERHATYPVTALDCLVKDRTSARALDSNQISRGLHGNRRVFANFSPCFMLVVGPKILFALDNTLPGDYLQFPAIRMVAIPLKKLIWTGSGRPLIPRLPRCCGSALNRDTSVPPFASSRDPVGGICCRCGISRQTPSHHFDQM
jgi:hypothetical protein